MRHLKTLFIAILFLPLSSYAQQTSTGTSLNQIMKDVDVRFDGEERIEGQPKYKHFARWAYWWSSHVNPDGSSNDVNKLNDLARQKESKINNSNNTRSTNSNWSFIGPTISTYASNASYCIGNGYGRVDRISFHPTDPNKLYICTPNGGAWHSADNGNNWECLTDNLPILGASGLEVDHIDDQTLYLLSGSADSHLSSFIQKFGYSGPSYGIFKSENHGKDWYKIMDFDTLLPPPIFNFQEEDQIPLNSLSAYRLKIHPLDPNVIFACMGSGLYHSVDKGDSWILHEINNITDIEFHPTDQNFIYASGISQMKYSNDKGQTWFNSIGVGACNNRIEISVSADSPDKVYMIKGGNVSTDGLSFCGYSISTDKGLTFTEIGEEPNLIGLEDYDYDQSNYDLCIATDPSDSDRVFVGGLQVFLSNDFENGGSAGWQNVAAYWENAGNQEGNLPLLYVHPDIHDIAFNPNSNWIYICSDGGLYRSLTGTSWLNKSEGIETSQVYNMNISPSDDSKIALGLQDNGLKMRETSNSENFRHVISGDGFETAFHPTTPHRVFVSGNNTISFIPSIQGLVRDVIPTDNDYFKPIRINPNNSNQVYIGAFPFEIATIVNNQYSSTSQSTTTTASASWEIETCDQITSRVYIAGGDNSYKNDADGKFHTSLDYGNIFYDRSTVTGFPAELVKITDISVDPNNCSNVAFSTGGFIDGSKIYYSTHSGGVEWINYSYNLPNIVVNAVMIDDDGNFFAGTDIGIYYLQNGSTDWIPYYNNIPRIPVTDLAMNNAETKIIASTFGRGVWESDLPDNCVTTLTIANDLEGNEFFESGNILESDAQITGGIGTNIDFHSSNSITLNPGFGVSTHSTFTGAIKPCGSPPDE